LRGEKAEGREGQLKTIFTRKKARSQRVCRLKLDHRSNRERGEPVLHFACIQLLLRGGEHEGGSRKGDREIKERPALGGCFRGEGSEGGRIGGKDRGKWSWGVGLADTKGKDWKREGK